MSKIFTNPGAWTFRHGWGDGLEIKYNEDIKMNTQKNKTSDFTDSEDGGTMEKFVLSGTAFWSHVHTPNTKGEYPSNKYQMDLSIDKKTKETLVSKGISVNKNDGKDKGGIKNRKDDRGDFVTLTSKFAPAVVDAKKKTISPETLIGNGSKVNIVAHTYDGKKGTALGLDAVQVTELVTFGNNPLDALEEVSGFTSTNDTMDDSDDIAKFD